MKQVGFLLFSYTKYFVHSYTVDVVFTPYYGNFLENCSYVNATENIDDKLALDDMMA